MKKNYAKVGWLSAFLLLSASVHSQVKVEAEDFTDAKSLSSEIITENGGKTIGYFDEEGEQLTYEVDIPSDGLYQVSFHYLTGKDGNVKIQDANGNYYIFDTQANNAEKWWEVPMSNWPDFPKDESALFPMKAGKQKFNVICTGKSVNLDYFTFTKSSSTDANVTKITTSPSKLNLMPDETIDIVAKGYNNAGELIASNTKWSSNVSNGRYKAASREGSDVITITMGETVKELKVKIAKPTKRQDFVVTKNGKLNTKDGAVRNEKGDKVCLMGPSWYWSCSAPQWWKAETVDYLVENWNIQLVRLPVSIAPCKDGQTPWTDKSQTWNTDNYLHSPEYTKALVDDMVRAAIENDIYVIIDFHEHYAQHWANLANEFFTYFATKWGEYPNVMYEIFNEPMCDDGTVVSYAKKVIPTIRKIDTDNIIIVGSSEYSRHPESVTAAGEGYSNIAYTWHGYVEWTHQGDWQSRGSNWNSGIPVVVTEWGMDPGNDGGLINTYRQHSVISAFWSMSNKGGNDAKWSVLKDDCFKTTGWSESDMTDDGKYMLNQCKGWINYKPVVTTPLVKELSMSICSAKKFFLPTDETTLTGDAAGGSENYKFAWKQVSGPNDATIANANSATTKVSGLTEGEYVFRLTVNDGEDEVSESVKVTVLPEGYVDPGLIDDMEDNDVITKWGGRWKSKDDSDKNANPHTQITASDNLVKDGVVKVDYTMGNQWPGDGWMGDPYCSVDMYLKKSEEGGDLSSCEKITYRYKGPAHEFRVCMTAVTDDDYHTKNVSASSDWTEVSVTWGNLKQASDWGKDIEFDAASIDKLSWQIKDGVGNKGTLYIDDVTCVGGHSNVENIVDETSFVIAPNPAKNGVANIYVAERCDVTVTDMTGRIVAQFVAVPELDNKISVRNTGIYVVKAGNSIQKLIVK